MKESARMQNNLPNTPESFPLQRYKPIRKLGEGGAGAVYLCHDTILNRDVSVKVLTYGSEERKIAFQREAQVTAKLRHENIVSILDFGTTSNGTPYMVLEFIEGTPADDFLRQRKRLPEILALVLAVQIADALECSHNSGIFHRDIKPSNIILTGNEEEGWHPRLIDFGIALLEGDLQKSTTYQNLNLVGTPKYMPPDVVLGKTYGERSEIYSVGCVLYEMLFGKLPFEADTAQELVAKHAYEPIPDMSDVGVSDETIEILVRCLEKDADNRFQNMSALKETLFEALELSTRGDEPKPAGEEPEAPVAQNSQKPVFVIAAAAGVSALVLIAVLSIAQLVPKPPPVVVKRESPIVSAAETKSARMLKDPFERFTTADGLNIKTRDTVPDGALGWLKRSPPIRFLNLADTDVTGAGFAQIEDVEILEVCLDGCPITDDGLAQVAKVKTMRSLFIQHCDHITNAGLEHLSASPSLLTVVFSGAQLNEQSVTSLKNIKNLVSLQPHGMKFTIDGARRITELPMVTNVLFRGGTISGEALEHISKDTRINSIGLSEIVLDDAAVDAIVNNPRRITFDITKCVVTPRSLKKLAARNDIYSAMVIICPEATDAELEAARQAFKGVNLNMLGITREVVRGTSPDHFESLIE